MAVELKFDRNSGWVLYETFFPDPDSFKWLSSTQTIREFVSWLLSERLAIIDAPETLDAAIDAHARFGVKQNPYGWRGISVAEIEHVGHN